MHSVVPVILHYIFVSFLFSYHKIYKYILYIHIYELMPTCCNTKSLLCLTGTLKMPKMEHCLIAGRCHAKWVFHLSRFSPLVSTSTSICIPSCFCDPITLCYYIHSIHVMLFPFTRTIYNTYNIHRIVHPHLLLIVGNNDTVTSHSMPVSIYL